MKSFTRNEAVYKRKRMMKISGMDTMDIAQLKSRKFGTDEYECLRFELIKQKSAQQSDASAPSKPACLSLALGNKIV